MSAAKGKKSEGLITVTAQQSRFHELDDSASNDIDINNLSISIGQRQILQNARLILKGGLRYVFAGRNGLGKSTVLKALAERKMPGISPKLRILLLDQTLAEERVDKFNAEAKTRSISVLEHVVSSDKLRKRILDDTALLSGALQEESSDPGKLSTTYRQLKLEESQRSLQEAQLVAQHRSGARGAKARQVLNAKEVEVQEAVTTLEKAGPDTAIDDLEAATVLLESLQLELDAMGSSTVEARARTTLIGLGFSKEQIGGPMSELSGGWQTRAALAAALIQQTDILLLDEPTNFLDLPAIIWLQHYLTTSLPTGTTLVVTTHDRDFADAVGERLLILRAIPAFTLEILTGTLTDHFAEVRRQIRRMTKMSAALEKKKAHMETGIRESLATAKRTGDDKKVKQAMSRKKRLEERTGLEVSAKGTRFKLNRDMAGWHNTVRNGIDIPELDPPVTIDIPTEPPELRNSAGSLVSLEKVSFTYKKAKRRTLDDITLTIQPGSRTGLVGLNGSGKSTLLRLIDSTSAMEAASLGKSTGVIVHHPQARVAQYNQFATTSLLQRGVAEPALTPLLYLSQLHPSIPEQQLRALMSGLALPPAVQAQTQLSALSGGQLVRVALAECLLPTPPQLFILDEPTTHLDADSIVALIQALKQYTGALLVVSHDRFFVRCVVEGMSVKQSSATADDNDEEESDSSDEEEGKVGGKVYRLTRTSGRMIYLERGMDEYEEIITRQLAKQGIYI